LGEQKRHQVVQGVIGRECQAGGVTSKRWERVIPLSNMRGTTRGGGGGVGQTGKFCWRHSFLKGGKIPENLLPASGNGKRGKKG